MVENLIKLVVALHCQDLLANSIVSNIEPVIMLLAIRGLSAFGSIESGQTVPVLFGKLGQANGFCGIVLQAGIVGFQYVKLKSFGILAHDDQIGKHWFDLPASR